MRRVFIADPALKSHHGHHHAVTSRFSMTLSACNEVVWLVNKKYQADQSDVNEQYIVESIFSEDTYDGYKKSSVKEYLTCCSRWLALVKLKIINIVRKLHKYLPLLVQKINLKVAHLLANIVNRLQVKRAEKAEEIIRPEHELYRVLRKYDYSSEDCVIFHTCDAHTYRDVLALFAREISILQWNRAPLFVLSTPYDMQVMPHNKTGISADHAIMHMRILGLIGTRILLCAENELLSEQLSAEWGVNVSDLYIPCTGGVPDIDNAHKNSVLNLAYLGAARTEKGFVEIAEVVENYLANNERRDVRFTVQVSPQIMGYTSDVEQAVSRLKAIDDDRLYLIDNVLTPEGYNQALLETDVIFLCYDKERYAVRSSGIVIEAIENAKNVIATNGTFPAFIAGDAGLIVKQTHEIINAINEVADKPEYYKKAALARRDWLLGKCSVEKFNDVISRTGKVVLSDSVSIEHVSAAPGYQDHMSWRKLL